MSATATKPMVVWTDIPVVDLDRAIRFYGAVLGVAIERQQTPQMTFAVLPHGDGVVGGCLVPCAGLTPGEHGPLVYLSCDGRLDAAVAAVAVNGGAVLEPKHAIGPHGWRALVRDSEGNRIALHSR